MTRDFTWRDGERLLRFADGALGEAPELLARYGFAGHVLVTTERALEGASHLAEAAAATLFVEPGPVAETAASLLDAVGDRAVVALGGGRVIDTTKAIAATKGLQCAAIPTTLSGAELTRIHRLPAGVTQAELVRPSLVISDPVLCASQPMPGLAASAMNGFAHAVEALYVPQSHPVAQLCALRACELIASGLKAAQPRRDDLALGAFLAAYALDASGYALHHIVCQSLVAVCQTPHAYTNAVMLSHSVGFMATRAPEAIARLARALAGQAAEAGDASASIASLGALCEVRRLSELGVDESACEQVAEAALARPPIHNTPPQTPTRTEIADLVAAAL